MNAAGTPVPEEEALVPSVRVAKLMEGVAKEAQDFRDQLAAFRRESDARLIQVFGAFVAIFSTLTVGGSTALQVASSATPQEALLRATAVLVPFLVAVILMLVVVGWLTGQFHRRPSDRAAP